MKQCTLCNEIKDVSCFATNKRYKNNLNSRCRMCMALKLKEWRAINPEKRYRQQNREYNREHKDKNKEYNKQYGHDHRQVRCENVKAKRAKIRNIVSELKSKPCTDCNISYPPYVMDFDHRPGVQKIESIAECVKRCWPLSRLLKEIAKCDLVCANCHRERTFTRKQHISRNIL